MVEAKDVKGERLDCEMGGEASLCDINLNIIMGGTTRSQASRVRRLRSSKGWVAAFQP